MDKTELIKQLNDFYKNGKDWERIVIKGVNGLSVVKLPPTQTRTAMLNITVNPKKNEKDLMNKDLFIRDLELFSLLKELFNSDITEKVINAMDNVNKEVVSSLIKTLDV